MSDISMSKTYKDEYKQLEFNFEDDGSYQGKPYWQALKKSLNRRRA